MQYHAPFIYTSFQFHKGTIKTRCYYNQNDCKYNRFVAAKIQKKFRKNVDEQ